MERQITNAVGPKVKIIHGDNHATLKVKTSSLTGEVRKRIEQIGALLSGLTNARSADSHVRKSEPDGNETRGLGGPRSNPTPRKSSQSRQ